MKNCIGIFVLCLAQLMSVRAQIGGDDDRIEAATMPQGTIAKTITSNNLKIHLRILAADEFEGRETGTKGNDAAAAYIAEQFTQIGLQAIGDDDTYFQPIEMKSKRWEKIEMKVDGKDYRHLWDFYAPHADNPGKDQISAERIVFVGYGIQDEKMDNYRKTDMQDAVVLMYGGEPRDENGVSLLSGDTEGSAWTSQPMKKINLAKKLGARTVLVIAEKFKEQVARNRRFLIGPSVELTPPSNSSQDISNDFQYLVISPEMAKQLIGKKINKVKKNRDKIIAGKQTKGQKIRSTLEGQMIKETKIKTTQNVIGLLPGKHPTKKEEYVFVTAHYDHLGKRGDDIFNGADDNGSGTATVIALAEALSLSTAIRPDRSIVFLLVSGEEKGLLGSKFYTDYPIIPLVKTIVDVNIDMVGRVDKEHEDPNYIYVIGADRLSTTLHDINESVNKEYENLELDYTYNALDHPDRYYYRSDHYNFAKKGIPAIFFFNGTHEDYHRPTDTVEKINFDKMAKIGRHIYHLIWELSNREEAIEVNVN